MSKKSDTLSFFEKDIVKKQMVILLTTFLISLITAIFPILLMLTLKNSIIGFSITMKGISHLVILLVLSNLIAATIGSTIGIIVKNDFSILISGAIYSVFLLISTQISNTLLHKFFNIFDDYLTVASNTLSEVIFNKTYYLDKIFLLLLILLTLLIVRCMYGQKRRIQFCILSVFILVALVSTVIIGEKNLQTFVPYQEFETDPYSIQSYKMDIVLQNKLYNKATLKLSISKDIDKIDLLLDHNFSIESVQVNHTPVAYTHKNNTLLIHSSHQKGEKVNLLIEYGGQLYVENDLGVISFYATPSAINLPGHVFYWYPKGSNIERSEFDVTIDTPAMIYSNLAKVGEQSHKLQGQSKNFHLFAGQYQKVSKAGIDYIFPISYKFEDFQETIDDHIERLLKSGDLSERDQKILEGNKYKQVIVGVWPLYMDFVELDDDTLLLNFLD